MLLYSVMLVLCVFKVESVVWDRTCPVINQVNPNKPGELDLKYLEGKWYFIAIASEGIAGECAAVVFSHKTDNTTDVSLSWISNNVVNFRNGSVELTPDPNSNGDQGDLLSVTYTGDEKTTQQYSFLTLDYEHYAVMFACDNMTDGNSSNYELWKISRTPQLKPMHIKKIAEVLNATGLEEIPLTTFSNTEKCNSAGAFHPTSLVLVLAAALAMCKRLY